MTTDSPPELLTLPPRIRGRRQSRCIARGGRRGPRRGPVRAQSRPQNFSLPPSQYSSIPEVAHMSSQPSVSDNSNPSALRETNELEVPSTSGLPSSPNLRSHEVTNYSETRLVTYSSSEDEDEDEDSIPVSCVNTQEPSQFSFLSEVMLSQENQTLDFPQQDISCQDILTEYTSSQNITSQENPSCHLSTSEIPYQQSIYQAISSLDPSFQEKPPQGLPTVEIPSQNSPIQNSSYHDLPSRDELPQKLPSGDSQIQTKGKGKGKGKSKGNPTQAFPSCDVSSRSPVSESMDISDPSSSNDFPSTFSGPSADPDQSQDSCVQPESGKTCCFCGQKFANEFNARRHEKNIHQNRRESPLHSTSKTSKPISRSVRKKTFV